MKKYLLGLSLFTMLITFSTPVRVFIHYVTMAELYARWNPEIFFPLAGILWVGTLFLFVEGYFERREKIERYWVMPRKTLDNFQLIPRHSLKDTDDLILVKEVSDD